MNLNIQSNYQNNIARQSLPKQALQTKRQITTNFKPFLEKSDLKTAKTTNLSFTGTNYKKVGKEATSKLVKLVKNSKKSLGKKPTQMLEKGVKSIKPLKKPIVTGANSIEGVKQVLEQMARSSDPNLASKAQQLLNSGNLWNVSKDTLKEMINNSNVQSAVKDTIKEKIPTFCANAQQSAAPVVQQVSSGLQQAAQNVDWNQLGNAFMKLFGG